MAFKNLGQAKPAAATPADLYVCPTAKIGLASSLFICNQGAGTAKFRVWKALAGAVTAAQQYLYFDVPLAANDTFVVTAGMGFSTTDVLRVQSDTGNVSFNLDGDES